MPIFVESDEMKYFTFSHLSPATISLVREEQ